MPTTRIPLPPPVGGVSRQPASERHTNQVENGENVLFSVVDGASKRPGSQHLIKLDSLFTLTAATWTAASLTLTETGAFTNYTYTEGDLVHISGGTDAKWGVYEIASKTDANNITLKSSISATNLSTGDITSGLQTGQSYRIHTIERDDDEKYIVIYGVNTLRIFDTLGREQIVVITDEARPYLDNDGTADLAGVIANDLALRTVADHTIIANRNVSLQAKQSDAFTITTTQNDYEALIATTPADGTYHRTKNGSTGQPAGYFKYNATGSADAAATFAKWYGRKVGNPWKRHLRYKAASRNPGAFRLTFTDSSGTATSYNIPIDMSAATINDMDDVASEFQSAIVAVTGAGPLVAWETLTAGGAGRFVLTGPDDGAGATISGFEESTDGAHSSHYKWHRREPFRSGRDQEVVEGTGTSAGAVDVFDRWVRQPAPGQLAAIPDETTMPIKMVRLSEAVTDDEPDVGDPTYNPAEFKLDVIDWTPRFTGDNITNPAPSIFPQEPGESRMLSDIAFLDNRLTFAADEAVVMSQAGDFFNLYLEEHDNIIDSDPIEAPLSSNEVTIADFLVGFRKTLVILTKTARQFELNSPEALTPSTASITPSTAYHTIEGVRPASMGHNLYFASNTHQAGVIYEYFFQEAQATNIAADITKHVFNYLPPDIQTIATSPNNNALMVITENDPTIYMYRAHWRGDEKLQSAWGKYTFNSGDRVIDAGIIREDAYLLVEIASGYVLDKLSISPRVPDLRNGTWFGDQISGLELATYTPITDGSFSITIDGVEADVSACDFSAAADMDDVAAVIQTRLQVAFGSSPLCRVQGMRFVITSGTTGTDSAVLAPAVHSGAVGTDLATASLLGTPGTAYQSQMPYQPRIDRTIEVTGTYNAGTNETTWDYGLDDPTLDAVVLGRDFGAAAGTVITPTRVTNASVKASGNFSWGEAYIGRNYLYDAELSQIYLRDQDGRPVLDGRLQLRKLVMNHRDTGAYSIQITPDGGIARTIEMIPNQIGISSVGTLAIDDQGTTEALVQAASNAVKINVVSNSPLPVTITGGEYIADFFRRTI